MSLTVYIMLYLVALLCCLVTGSLSIVCTPELCDGIKQQPLNCAGDVIKKGGFCGCFDVCAGTEGEPCQLEGGKFTALLGVPSTPSCSSEFECVELTSGSSDSLLRGKGVCQKKVETTTRGLSQCERTRNVRMISFAIWEGWYIPKCNSDGTFQAKQCDNTGSCFCVGADDGVIIEGSKRQYSNFLC